MVKGYKYTKDIPVTLPSDFPEEVQKWLKTGKGTLSGHAQMAFVPFMALRHCVCGRLAGQVRLVKYCDAN